MMGEYLLLPGEDLQEENLEIFLWSVSELCWMNVNPYFPRFALLFCLFYYIYHRENNPT